MFKMIKTKHKMKLEITGVDGKGHVEKIYLIAHAEINLKDYLIYDATFADDGKPSNRGRHAYRFQDHVVEAGHKITLRITNGISTVLKIVGNLYLCWNRNNPIINDTGDYLTLIEIKDKQVFSTGPKQ